MRSRSLARVVIAFLGVSVVVTLGCGGSPGGPSAPFSVLSISPTEGSMAGNTPVVITGTGFIIRGQGGATLTVDGSRVAASPSADGNTIRFLMPAHAVGKVDVTVTAPLGQGQASVPGGYTYVPLPPPVITGLLPNTGSTAGGTPVYITGSLFNTKTVTVGGIVTPYDTDIGGTAISLSMPAHAAGTVDVIVTNADGQSASALFTYASPSTFDFNGDWKGTAHSRESAALVWFTIRENRAVSVLCFVCRDPICAIGSAPSETLDPPPVVANGEFSYAGSGGVSITGKITSAVHATGSITTPSCGSRHWEANK